MTSIKTLKEKKMINKEEKEKKAIELFHSGYNCAQAVLTAFSDELKTDKKYTTAVACGFGGGMGRLQETCGAVTGSFMVLGIFNSNMYSDNNVAKDETYEMIQRFSEKFKLINGSTDCKSLLKCEIKSPEGRKWAKENKVFETVCEKCIIDSVKLIEELIN